MGRFAERQRALEEAQMQATIQLARSGDVPARLRSRRARDLAPVRALPKADDPLFGLLRCKDLRDQAIQRATALYLGNDIALFVTPLARAEISARIGEDLRLFAVQNRKFGRIPELPDPMAADSPALCEALLETYGQCRDTMALIWAQQLPAPLDKEMAPTGQTAPDALRARQMLACLLAVATPEAADD